MLALVCNSGGIKVTWLLTADRSDFKMSEIIDVTWLGVWLVCKAWCGELLSFKRLCLFLWRLSRGSRMCILLVECFQWKKFMDS